MNIATPGSLAIPHNCKLRQAAQVYEEVENSETLFRDRLSGGAILLRRESEPQPVDIRKTAL